MEMCLVVELSYDIPSVYFDLSVYNPTFRLIKVTGRGGSKKYHPQMFTFQS